MLVLKILIINPIRIKAKEPRPTVPGMLDSNIHCIKTKRLKFSVDLLYVLPIALYLWPKHKCYVSYQPSHPWSFCSYEVKCVLLPSSPLAQLNKNLFNHTSLFLRSYSLKLWVWMVFNAPLITSLKKYLPGWVRMVWSKASVNWPHPRQALVPRGILPPCPRPDIFR